MQTVDTDIENNTSIQRNQSYLEKQLFQTNTAFQTMSEVREELSLIKDRLDLCELRNKDLENKLKAKSATHLPVIDTIEQHTDLIRDLEDRLLQVIAL